MQAQDPPSEQPFRLSAKIVGMGCSVTFLRVRRLLDLLRLGPSPDAKDIEIAVLRHQLTALAWQSTSSSLAASGKVVSACSRESSILLVSISARSTDESRPCTLQGFVITPARVSRTSRSGGV